MILCYSCAEGSGASQVVLPGAGRDRPHKAGAAPVREICPGTTGKHSAGIRKITPAVTPLILLTLPWPPPAVRGNTQRGVLGTAFLPLLPRVGTFLRVSRNQTGIFF